MTTPERYHWINVMVGVLDGAFHLTDNEQFRVIEIVSKLLERLHIPERSVPATRPPCPGPDSKVARARSYSADASGAVTCR
jgi:hypothetical protein